MIHRHPHVFAGRHYDSVEQQQADWEKLKSQEEGHKQTSLKEEIAFVPESFPALIRGQKIAKKAAAAGLFSTEDEDVFKDLANFCCEFTARHRWGRSREKIQQ